MNIPGGCLPAQAHWRCSTSRVPARIHSEPGGSGSGAHSEGTSKQQDMRPGRRRQRGAPVWRPPLIDGSLCSKVCLCCCTCLRLPGGHRVGAERGEGGQSGQGHATQQRQAGRQRPGGASAPKRAPRCRPFSPHLLRVASGVASPGTRSPARASKTSTLATPAGGAACCAARCASAGPSGAGGALAASLARRLCEPQAPLPHPRGCCPLAVPVGWSAGAGTAGAGTRGAGADIGRAPRAGKSCGAAGRVGDEQLFVWTAKHA